MEYQDYEYEGDKVRLLNFNGEVVYCLFDVCIALGLSLEQSKALRGKVINHCGAYTIPYEGLELNATFVNSEQLLYALKQIESDVSDFTSQVSKWTDDFKQNKGEANE